MVQCPDCEDKDKIVIAGKPFCANCGTPWQPSSTVGSEEAVKSTVIAPPALGTTQSSATRPISKSSTISTTPMQIKNIVSPPTNKTPPLPPQSPSRPPELPRKINDINSQLKSLRNADALHLHPEHKKTSIVQEISNNIAVQPAIEHDGPSKSSSSPIIPHSPIGDLKEGNTNIAVNSTKPQLVKNAFNPQAIDDKVLAINANIIQANPIPTERIQAVINEVIAARNPIKKTPPHKVLSDQIPRTSQIQTNQTAQVGLPIVSAPSQAQRYSVASTIPKSTQVNRFATTPAHNLNPAPIHTIAPPPPPPPPKNNTPVSSVPPSENTPKAQTFSDLAQVVPIKQPGPIDVAIDAQAPPSQNNNSPQPATTQNTSPGMPDTKAEYETLVATVGSTASPQKYVAQSSSDSQQSPQIIKQAAMAMAESAPSTEVAEHIGSEIVSLDSKDESILSDDEFKELSAVKANPTNQSAKVDSISQTPQQPNSTVQNQTISTPDLSASNTTPTKPVQKPKTIKPLDITAPTISPANSSNQSNTVTTPQVNPLEKQDIVTVLPPSPDGITPGKAYRPAQAIDYPITAPKPVVEQDASKPLTDEEALNLVHQHESKVAKLPLAKVGHSFSASSLALSAFGLILVGAYIWQINYPNLAFKVAASKAGISASSPNYIPSGWKLSNNIKTSPGTVSYNLLTDGNKRQVAITETKSDWDSQALAENYIAGQSTKYLALQAQGLTIYMYGDSQASWINRGKWYRIEGQNHGLSQDQIIKIATSL